MKTIHFLSSVRLTVMLLLISAIAAASCKKDHAAKSGSGGTGNVPHANVPEPFAGTFMYITSTGGYVDESGHHIPGVAQGITLHIEGNGTGSSLYHVETGSYDGSVTTDEIRCECTYEITKTSANTANIIIHYVSGKNYHNGVFQHDLNASQLYPNGDAVWNDCEFGTDNQGNTYFIVGSGSNAAQFTKQ